MTLSLKVLIKNLWKLYYKLKAISTDFTFISALQTKTKIVINETIEPLCQIL